MSDTPKTIQEVVEGAQSGGQIYVPHPLILRMSPVFPKHLWNLKCPDNGSVGFLGVRGLEGGALCVGGKSGV